MKTNRIIAVLAAASLAAGSLAPVASACATEGDSAMDHSQMDHAQHAMQPDSQGRIGYDMKHQMDPALVDEIRDKVTAFSAFSDAEIALAMDTMGMEYAWYISPPSVKGKQGVLILFHGFREQGDKIFKEQMQPIGNIFPTALGVGMAMMMSSHIQNALDALTAAGATEIVVVPVVSTSVNELYRQWLYIFGLQKQAEYASVPRVKTSAKIGIIEPPGDDPLIGEILLDYANELSTDPKNEVVIIAAHGPGTAADNEKEMQILASLGRIIKEDGGYSAVYGQTLQDDAPPEIRAANVAKLRALVENATKSGKQVIIVTNLIGARTIQAKLRDDLKGLDYKFNAKGIIQHDNFIRWLNTNVRKEMEKLAGR